MKIIDFHTHPYMEGEKNLCMYREAYALSPMEQKQQLERAGITKICGSVNPSMYVQTVQCEEIKESDRENIFWLR